VLRPVSILKTRVTEAVNRNVRRERRSVVIVEDSKHAKGGGDQESEDSALCLQEEDSLSDLPVHDLDHASAPGSIADREHRKWVEKAIPLSNNPYSMENITKRRTMSQLGEESIVSLRSLSEAETALSVEEKEEDSALSSIYASLYNRDYYVQMNNNNNNTTEDTIRRETEKQHKTEVVPGSREVHYWGASAGQMSEESSVETDQLQDSLEESKVTEKEKVDVSVTVEDDHSEVPALSVSEEIKKLQQEIAKVTVENVKYPSWKRQRIEAWQARNCKESEKDTKRDNGKPHLQKIAPQEEMCVAQELPPKKTGVPKKVSYAENEVTVLLFTEEAGNSLIPEEENKRSSSRQIHPDSHIAPAEPPRNINDDLSIEHVDDIKDGACEDTADVSVLPSVKELANKFKVKKAEDTKLVTATKQETAVRVPTMLAVKKPFGGYPQVHSITARSVPREFRESLRLGRSGVTDTIFKLPGSKQKGAGNNRNNIIKGTEVCKPVSTADHFTRNYSPECSGIPALPAVIPARRQPEQGYSSEDSSYTW